MKSITRKLLFSAVSLYTTAQLVEGFSVRTELEPFLITASTLAIVYYLIAPLMKLVLLPLNIVTMGSASFIIYILMFHYVIASYKVISIKQWILPGGTLSSLYIPTLHFNYWSTLIVSALVYSTIISLLDRLV